MNVDKISKKIERELERLAKARFKRTGISKLKLLSKMESEIIKAARYFSKMCRDRETCFRLLVELMRRYRPDDVISWLQEKILSGSETLDVEIQRTANELSIQMRSESCKSKFPESLLTKIRRLLKLG